MDQRWFSELSTKFERGDTELKSKVAKLARDVPELRKHLIPLQLLWQIVEAGDPQKLFKMMQEESEAGIGAAHGKSSGSATRLTRGQRTGGV